MNAVILCPDLLGIQSQYKVSEGSWGSGKVQGRFRIESFVLSSSQELRSACSLFIFIFFQLALKTLLAIYLKIILRFIHEKNNTFYPGIQHLY